MLSRLTVTFMLLLAGCGGYLGETHGKTTQGWNVHLSGWPDQVAPDEMILKLTSRQIELVGEVFAGMKGVEYEKVQKALRGANHLFYEWEMISCPQGGDLDRLCFGLFQPPNWVFVTYPNVGWDGEKWVKLDPTKHCLGLTALAHEITHYLAYKVLGHANGDHSDPELFGPGSVSNVASYQFGVENCGFGADE